MTIYILVIIFSDVLNIFHMLQSDDRYTYASCIFYTKFSLYTSGSFLIYALPKPIFFFQV